MILAVIVLLIIITAVAFILSGKGGGDDDVDEVVDDQSIKAKQKGRLGENLVKGQGEKHLDPTIYIPFHNITIYNGDTTSQIDHIYLSVYGIFVLETKHYSGWIYGNEYDKVWTQTFSKHKKFTLPNPLHQNYGHIKFLQNFMTVDMDKFHSLVVFSGNCQLKTKLPDNVCMLDNFCDYILSFDKPIFSADEVQRMAEFLRARFLPQTDNALKFHVHHVSKD